VTGARTALRHLLAPIALSWLFLSPGPAQARWVAVWTAAPFPATTVLSPRDVRDYGQASVRQEAVLAAAGTRLRVRLTNVLGTAPLVFESASVEIDGRRIALRFGGVPSATLPAGAELTSDPVPVVVRPFQRIAITISYGADANPAAHLLPVTVRYPDGRTQAGRGPALASAIEVDRTGAGSVLVALGDSITEGARAQPQSFTGWPELFAARLGPSFTIVNAGIHGNRLLRDGAGPSALARFDRDVLSVAGVSHVFLLEGINDIGWGNAKPDAAGPVRADDVIAGYRQIIARAHAAGLRIIGATLPPFRGSVYFTTAGERARRSVNAWIRTSHAFDAVVDFDRVLADPVDRSRLAPAKEAGDHLHPSDAGYAAMAAAIDPTVLMPR
jgi:lysophospholipase L1-like esterase